MTRAPEERHGVMEPEEAGAAGGEDDEELQDDAWREEMWVGVHQHIGAPGSQ